MTLPSPSQLLTSELESLTPVSTRKPTRDFAMWSIATLALGGLALLALGLRPDLGELSAVWVASFVLLWWLGCLFLGNQALRPRQGQTMPTAGLGALLATAAWFVVGGGLLSQAGPSSLVYEPSLANVLRYSPYCVVVGLAIAFFPAALGAWFLRCSEPAGHRRIAALIGAAAGCLGGWFLHLHCYIAEHFHVGLVHGGVVALAAGLGALALSPVLLTRPRSTAAYAGM